MDRTVSILPTERCWHPLWAKRLTVNQHGGLLLFHGLLLLLCFIILHNHNWCHSIRMQLQVTHHVKDNTDAINHQAQKRGDDPEAEEYDRSRQLEEEQREKHT